MNGLAASCVSKKDFFAAALVGICAANYFCYSLVLEGKRLNGWGGYIPPPPLALVAVPCPLFVIVVSFADLPDWLEKISIRLSFCDFGVFSDWSMPEETLCSFLVEAYLSESG